MKRTLMFTILLSGLMASAQAQSPQERYQSDKRAANARYAQDRQICDDERNSGQHMKCLRAAKAENTQALAAAQRQLRADGGQRAAPTCQTCGRVTAVRSSRRDGESNALGVVGGGVVGGLLGNQVGSGSGKAVATVAGAVGGAYAGKKIQERARRYTVWTVDVQYDNGRRRSFTYKRDPGVQRGDRVKNAGQSIMRI